MRTTMAKAGANPVHVQIPSRLLNQYRAKKATLQQLADAVGVSVATVWRELNRQGLVGGSRRGRPPSSKMRSLVLALAAQGWARGPIADHLHVTAEWVRSILAEHGQTVPMHVLKCQECGAIMARGHKVYQGKQPAVCLTCLQKNPQATMGQRLRAVRLAENLSLAELSQRSGLSRAILGVYEHDRAVPSLESVRKLAQALGHRATVLMGLSGA
jgi:transcriptional regulator with XRE-family HTH domain